jgi:hypothetical protein
METNDGETPRRRVSSGANKQDGLFCEPIRVFLTCWEVTL